MRRRALLGLVATLLVVPSAQGMNAQSPPPSLPPSQMVSAAELCGAYLDGVTGGSAVEVRVPSEEVQFGPVQQFLSACVLSAPSFVSNETVIVWEDPVNGFICIQATEPSSTDEESKRGSACMLTSDEQPMVTGLGTDPSEPILMTIVDPQHRLGGADFRLGGVSLDDVEAIPVANASDESGLALAALVPQWPDEVIVTGPDGFELVIDQQAHIEDATAPTEGEAEE